MRAWREVWVWREGEDVGVEDECPGITLDMLNLAKAVPNVKAIWPSN